MVELIRKLIKWILLIILFIFFIILIIRLAGNGSKTVKNEVKKNVEIIKEEVTKEDVTKEDTKEEVKEETIVNQPSQEVNTPDTASNGTLEFIIGIIILSGTTYYIYHNKKLQA